MPLAHGNNGPQTRLSRKLGVGLMRLRWRKIRAMVRVQQGDSPVVISFGPGYCFEATINETVHLATDLINAIEQARRGGRVRSTGVSTFSEYLQGAEVLLLAG